MLKCEESTRISIQIPYIKLKASAGSAGVKLHHLWPLKKADGYGTLQSGTTASFSWDTFYRKINSSGLLKDVFTISGS